jgi:cobalt-zinc-cadmium efflux system membrane fusion protein
MALHHRTILIMKTISIAIFVIISGTSLTASTRAHSIILNEQGARNLRIETVEANYQTFEKTAFAIGRIAEIPSSRSVLSTRVAGRVIKLDAFEGDYVTAGQRIAVIESRQLGDPPPTVELFAPQDGLVVASHVRIGQPVEPSAELMYIVDRSTVWAVAQIAEQDLAKVAIGSRAYIRVPALGDEIVEATVKRFGVEADPRTGSTSAIFAIPNAGGRLRPGMRVEFSIVLDSRADVLAIPREAVQGDSIRRVVFVKDLGLNHAFLRTAIVTGEQNEQSIEVLEGLLPGDRVVTHGSYALSFASPDAGISLREALDAAHGHAHNEDGSEITHGQKTDHDHEDHSHEADESHSHLFGEDPLSGFLIAYASTVTLALLLLVQHLWNRKRKAGTDAQEMGGRDA